MTRRSLLAAPFACMAAGRRPRVGLMDTTLRMPAKPEAVARARELGFEGMQVTLGRNLVDGKMPLSDPALQQRYLEEFAKQKVTPASTYIDILHANCLKSDAAGAERVREGIEITRRLKAPILMTVFFGKCAIESPAETDSVVAALKELAPVAQKAGVILGFENLLSGEANLKVLDRVGSPALKVYYDIGNSTNVGGYDVAAELKAIGRGRLCQVHFKDKGYLGEGKVDVSAATRSLASIGYDGWIILETGSPSGQIGDDLQRNAKYVRDAVEAAYG